MYLFLLERGVGTVAGLALGVGLPCPLAVVGVAVVGLHATLEGGHLVAADTLLSRLLLVLLVVLLGHLLLLLLSGLSLLLVFVAVAKHLVGDTVSEDGTGHGRGHRAHHAASHTTAHRATYRADNSHALLLWGCLLALL